LAIPYFFCSKSSKKYFKILLTFISRYVNFILTLKSNQNFKKKGVIMTKKKTPLRVFRELKGISQYDLAKKLKINRAILSQLETGRVIPNIDLMRQIAKELDCLITDLYYSQEIEVAKNAEKNRI